MQQYLTEMAIGSVAVPFAVWVTTSIFNQKTEIALMRQSHDSLKDLIETLITVLKENKES